MNKKTIVRLSVLAAFVATFIRLVHGGSPSQSHLIEIDYQPVTD